MLRGKGQSYTLPVGGVPTLFAPSCEVAGSSITGVDILGSLWCIVDKGITLTYIAICYGETHWKECLIATNKSCN